MIILDTNVLSELVKPDPSCDVIEWLDRQEPTTIWVTSMTVGELLAGVAQLPAGKRRDKLRNVVGRLVDAVFADRIAAFDHFAAVEYAGIVTDRQSLGRPISMADALIASICRARSAALATRNTADFDHTGIELIDPWSPPESA